MRLVFPLLATLFLTGCAAKGEFPSLQPRPIELALAEEANAEPQAPPEVADNAELASELAALRAAAARTQGEFQKEYSAAERLVARAGAGESDSWVEAQQGLSRVEAARHDFADVLADLDQLALRYENKPLSTADRKALEDVIAELKARAEAEQREFEALAGRLSPP
jgi:hypothetical protein